MKILIVSPNYPYPADKGDRIRVNGVIQLIKYLSYEIDLVCLDSRQRQSSQSSALKSIQIFPISKISSSVRMFKNLFLGKSFSSAYYQNARFVKAIDHKLSSTKYDLVIVFSSAFDYLIPLFAKHQIKVFWDLIDFDSLKWEQFAKSSQGWKRWIFLREAKSIKQAEAQIMKFADLVAIISKREISRYLLDSMVADKIFVLPQPMEVRQAESQQKSSAQLVFTGQMDYMPNIEAVKFFEQEVMPMVRQKYPDIVFKVVGRNPSKDLITFCQQAVFSGEVVDVHSILAESTIAVVPLKSVFGVPIKVLDAMSHGLPTIVTSDVAEAIEAQIVRDLLVANSAIEFANQIDFLLQNPKAAQQISENANSFIVNNFGSVHVSRNLKLKLESLFR